MNKVESVTKRVIIGKRISYLRNLKKLSQSELGKLLGKGQGMISRIELGLSDINTQDLTKLANILDSSANYILNGDESININEDDEIIVSEPPSKYRVMEGKPLLNLEMYELETVIHSLKSELTLVRNEMNFVRKQFNGLIELQKNDTNN